MPFAFSLMSFIHRISTMSSLLVRDQRQNVDQKLRAELQVHIANLQAARTEVAKLQAIKIQLELQLADLRQQHKEARAEIGTF